MFIAGRLSRLDEVQAQGRRAFLAQPGADVSGLS
jgi:hypothetical protein